MTNRIFQVDAFASEPFRGNPAAVCLVSEPKDAAWMQAVAAEMNLSETAFVSPERGHFALRWFTPGVEVPLCGHATLASAHVLWQVGDVPGSERIHFESKSGLLVAERAGDWIELDFPALPSRPCQLPAHVSAAIDSPVVHACSIPSGSGEPKYLLELESETQVRELSPKLDSLRYPGASHLIVTAISDSPDYDFVSRYFAPGAGIDEDPVTGAAHCCLAPYFQARLGKREFTGYQASARGGVVKMRCENARVRLSGQAVSVLSGVLDIP